MTFGFSQIPCLAFGRKG